MRGYDHKKVEEEAQKKWADLDLYATDLADAKKDPYYLLFEFPYPSGDLHIGHWYAFAVTDIYARYLRMKGKNVLFPIGFDAFGLPAENAAIKNGADPAAWTEANMDRMRKQIRSMGTSVDWSKEVVTCSPEYYKWTQWLFSKFYEHDLAERREAPVKWCPKDNTVLANEQVVDGKCERCGTEVEEKRLTQWFMKITKYAERLLSDLDALPWREDIKDAQRAWIGKSEGARISFKIVPAAEADSASVSVMPEASVDVFTTRPDTIFGATYVVLAPEHPLLNELIPTLENEASVSAYVSATKQKTERERSESKEKTGVRLEGVMAVNPANQERIPVYVADYVLGSYGTGAVMAVPAHDERDYAFAKKHELPIRTVVEPKFNSTGDAELKPDLPIVKREAVCAVVRNPKDDSYLCTSWKKVKMNGLVTGGIDEGETAEQAARREVFEETGYKNLKHIDRPEIRINTFFYHRMKEVNRHAHFTYAFFELENEEREDTAQEEKDLHEVKWVRREDFKSFFTVHEGEFIGGIIDSPDFIHTGPGILANSAEFTGMDSEEAKWAIVQAVGGERVTQYRMRDWLVSRQRYWGCPIPVVYDPEGKPHLVPADHLPWLLPKDVDFKSDGAASPLASSKELKERVTDLFGEGWTPEYDTLDTFVDSSWYFLRYLDPKDDHDFSDQAMLKKWLPVDRYSGGVEHTTMHLLYSRFFHKALYDLALVPTPEPYDERFNRGLILGTDGQKMSKRWGNVVNPDGVVAEFGTDAVRLYLAFIGPYNEPGNYPWNLDGVTAMRKFLDRVKALEEKVSDADLAEGVLRMLAKAEAKVSADSERFKFNTAVSALMVLVRDLESLADVPRGAYQTLVRLAAPFAPHLAESLWTGEGSVHAAPWPSFDQSLLVSETVQVTVQVGGKRRGEITVSPALDEAGALEAALRIPAVEAALGGRKPSRVVYVPGRILNLVP